MKAIREAEENVAKAEEERTKTDEERKKADEAAQVAAWIEEEMAAWWQAEEKAEVAAL